MKILFAVLFVLISFVGCQKVALHHNLEEIEADEILVLLQQQGIEAEKVKEQSGQEVSWKIAVKKDEMAKARQILISSNLPRKRELGLSGVYKEKGLIPTPDEQKARSLLALKGEITNSLEKIQGVVDADVVLNIPEESEFAPMDQAKKRPTASVVIRTRNEELIVQTVTEGKIQRFVANSVPEMDPNDVAVIVSRTDMGSMLPMAGSVSPSPFGSSTPPRSDSPSVASGDLVDIGGIRLEEDSVGRFKAYMIGLLAILVAVSGFLLVNIVRLNRLKLTVQRGSRTAGSERSALPSGSDRSLLVDGGGAMRQEAVEGTFDVAGNSPGRIGR